jgi:hypothetical protein
MQIPHIPVRADVREKYGQAALGVTTGGSSCCGVDAIALLVENKFMSAFIRAVKPAPAAVKPTLKECCGPACCS